jgi:hypothetical protein
MLNVFYALLRCCCRPYISGWLAPGCCERPRHMHPKPGCPNKKPASLFSNIKAGATNRYRTGAKPTTRLARSLADAPICVTRRRGAVKSTMAIPGIEEMKMKTRILHPRALSLTVLSAALLGGCASFSQDGGFDAIQTATQSRIQKDVVWSRDDATRRQSQARIDALLAQPLSADDAVQIALLNNPGLQAAFNTLGIAEADWVSARSGALADHADACRYRATAIRADPA